MEIRILKNLPEDTVSIFIIEAQGQNRFQITLTKNNTIEKTHIHQTEPQTIQPFITLPTKFFDELARTLRKLSTNTLRAFE